MDEKNLNPIIEPEDVNPVVDTSADEADTVELEAVEAETEAVEADETETQAAEADETESNEAEESDFTREIAGADVLIQDLEDITEETPADDAEDEGEKFYCARCEQEVPEFTELCEDCERKIKRYPISFGKFILAFLLMLVSMTGALTVLVNYPIALSVFKGDVALSRKELAKCYEYYAEAYEKSAELNMLSAPPSAGISPYTFFTSGNNTLARQFLAINELNGPYVSGQYLERYYEDKKVPFLLRGIKKEYDGIAAAVERMNEEYELYFQNVQTEDDVNFSDLLAILARIEAEGSYPGYIMEYFRMEAAKMTNADLETRLSHIEKVIEMNSDAMWLYAADAIAAYKESGDFAKALSVCQKLIKKDRTNPSAVADAMSVLRMDGKFGEAMQLYDMSMNNMEQNPAMEREFAIIMLLQGDVDGAHDRLTENYVMDENLTAKYVYALMISALLAEDDEMYGEMNMLLIQNGMMTPDKIQRLGAGSVTVQDIFMKGTGEAE
ncbi:MAG: hypothetical protein FWF05_06010 [Oscillospiraceae bacterium]|nr:hypothetical protein [Oscillospiraceae bacterium]